MSGSAKITEFPGAAQVPTVGQRLCPLMSKAVPTSSGQIGTIQVQCAGQVCRLWEMCSGRWVETLRDALAEVSRRFGEE